MALRLSEFSLDSGKGKMIVAGTGREIDFEGLAREIAGENVHQHARQPHHYNE
jgi:hypothetical protein